MTGHLILNQSVRNVEAAGSGNYLPGFHLVLTFFKFLMNGSTNASNAKLNLSFRFPGALMRKEVSSVPIAPDNMSIA